jgi:mannosyltransferase OCH1-like enzyme
MIIPNLMTHIWVGDSPPPTKWLNSWKILHPNWEYSVFSNKDLSNHQFKNIDVIEYYLKSNIYSGAADVIRYELLYMYGGFIPPADSVCMINTDELFVGDSCEMAYVVYENEKIRPHMICPVYAATPKHPFLKKLIDEISTIPIDKLSVPYTSVGNMLVSKNLYKQQFDNITKFPSHYFVPNHFMGTSYSGNGKVYATQMWGSTLGIYDKGR